jgi:hypothetical protein
MNLIINKMGKLILKFAVAFIFTLPLLFISSCSEDALVTPEPETNDTSFAVNGVYVVSSGGGLSYYRELSYYDFDKNEYKENIYKNGFGYLPILPTSITYGNGYLFISNFQGSILKISLQGDSAGVVFGDLTSFIYGFDNRIFVSYFQPLNASFVIRSQENMNQQNNVLPDRGYISSVAYDGHFLYLTHSQSSSSYDSSLVKYDQENGIIDRVPVNRWASGITISNTGKIIVGCKEPGNTLYTIDPNTMQKLDSARIPDGFRGNLCADKSNPVVYFMSANDKIISYNINTKVFSSFILSSDSPVYSISAYLFDNTLKKHFVAFTGNQPNQRGLLKIYNISGLPERTYTTGVNPVGIVAVKFKFPD